MTSQAICREPILKRRNAVVNFNLDPGFQSHVMGSFDESSGQQIARSEHTKHQYPHRYRPADLAKISFIQVKLEGRDPYYEHFGSRTQVGRKQPMCPAASCTYQQHEKRIFEKLI